MARFVDDTIGPPQPAGTAPIPIPTPAPRATLVQAQVPGAAGKPGYGHNMTLAALMERQQQIAQQQAALQQGGGGGTIVGGLGMLANTFVNALADRRARKAEEEGNAEVAAAYKTIDPTTGMPSPEAMDAIMRRAPDVGMDLYKTAMTLRASQAKTENWVTIPTPQGESGQWYQNTTTGEQKKVGGSTEGGGWKPSDIGSLRDDYTKAAATYTTADPSWTSMKQAAATALDPATDVGGKGAADYNMIVAFAKLLDPNSVVREGEVKSASMTGGMIDQLQGWLNTVKGQGSLSDDVRRGIMNEANSRMSAYYGEAKTKRDWITGIATRHQINPDDVVSPLGEFTPWTEAEPPPNPDTPEVETVPDGAGVDGQATTQPEGTEAHGSDGNDYVVVGGKWKLKPKGAPNAG
jgi:hypothetical protein